MKKGIVFGIGLMVVAVMANAGSINWFNTAAVIDPDTGSAVVRNGGGGNQWIVALVQAVGGVDDLTSGGFSDDIVLQTASYVNPFADGFINAIYQPTSGGFDVYAVAFDASDVVDQNNLGSATRFAYGFGAGSAVAPVTINPLGVSDTAQFNFGTIAQGDWQAVPEPSTLALMLLGVGAVYTRIRRRK